MLWEWVINSRWWFSTSARTFPPIVCQYLLDEWLWYFLDSKFLHKILSQMLIIGISSCYASHALLILIHWFLSLCVLPWFLQVWVLLIYIATFSSIRGSNSMLIGNLITLASTSILCISNYWLYLLYAWDTSNSSLFGIYWVPDQVIWW